MTWCIGTLLTMFGTNIFLPRCRCLLGTSCVTDYLPKTVWPVGVFFIQMTQIAWSDVTFRKRPTTYFLDVACQTQFGLLCGTGLAYGRLHPVYFEIILFNFLIWQSCRDFHILFYRSFGLSVFGYYRRRWTTVSFKIRLQTLNYSLSKLNLIHSCGWNLNVCRLAHFLHDWWKQPLLCMGVHV